MVTVDNTTAHAVRLQLCGLSTVECHHLESASCGNSIYWEQQFWLAAIGIIDRVSYRKVQVRREYLERIIGPWGLFDNWFSHGTSEGRNLRQTVLNTPMLIAWLACSHRQFLVAHAGDLEIFGTCIREIIALAKQGLAFLNNTPSITLFGVELQLLGKIFGYLYRILRMSIPIFDVIGRMCVRLLVHSA